MSSKEEFLKRIRQSLGEALIPEGGPEHPGSFRGYTYPAEAAPETLIDSFRRELETLSGHVHIAETPDDLLPILLQILRQHQATRLIAWDEAELLDGVEPELSALEPALAEAGITLETGYLAPDRSERGANLAGIEPIQVGLTGAQAGLADTGAVALVSGPGRGRLASLLPPVHITLLPARKLYPSLPAFLAANPTLTGDGSNLVLIAGPSRTGDIEMTLSMGVHGPGEVHVIILP